MYFYEWIIENRIILKFLYTIVLAFICFIIVVKADKLFRLSSHQGIRYFRNAFLFYGLAFIIRQVLVTFYDIAGENFGVIDYLNITKLVFEFFLVMAGFFLLYSLLWKRAESTEHSVSSLFNTRIFIFYVLAIITVYLDYLWGTFVFMYLSQIVVFSFAGGICFAKYGESEKREGFFKLYMMVIVLNLILWTANFILASSFRFVVISSFEWQKLGVIATYALNLIIFLLFLYAVTKATQK